MTATYPPPGFPNDEPRIEPGPGLGTASLPAPPGTKRAITGALQRLPRWAGPAAVGGLALASCAFVGLVDPNQPHVSPLYPVCTFKQLTGFDCPGCGLTRAMHSLVTGHPVAAIDHNIFIAAIFPLAAYMYVRWLLRTTVGYELPAVRASRAFTYAILPIVLSFWVLRNIPVMPFAWLGSGVS